MTIRSDGRITLGKIIKPSGATMLTAKRYYQLTFIALLSLLTACATHETTEQGAGNQNTSAPQVEEEVTVSGIRASRSSAEEARAKKRKAKIARREAASQSGIRSVAPIISSARAPSTTSKPAAPAKIPQLLEPPHNNEEDYDLRSVPASSYQIFKNYGVNPTILTESKDHSTFAMDVDSASYSLASKMLTQGRMPNPAGIRIEEFVNAFSYQYQQSDQLFSLSAEAAPSPFRQGYHALHIGVQTRTLADHERKPANIVLVADISGSMAGDQKLDLLKQAFVTLISQLNKHDRIALVTYSDNARIAIKPTQVRDKRKIYADIRALKTEGSTNAAAGIQLAYKVAADMYEPGFINRVVLTSDGMANVGTKDPQTIVRNIKEQKDKGIFLTTVGVGTGMYNDHLLEQLANQGNGHYLHLSNTEAIQSAFVDRLTSELQVVAKNAKIQVVFNPQAVSHYRLLGYENRALKKQDFLDADKDGGELGAGHHVTAIYEVKLTPEYQQHALGELKIAYQKPEGQRVLSL
ncbi:MAG: hypothetical protein COA42_19730, partial [Alteromonadaceae bacterium]